MTRFSFILGSALALAASLVGCQQHNLVAPKEMQTYKAQALATPLPMPEAGDLPSIFKGDFQIRTVLDPDGKRREMALAECIALALENGRDGSFFDSAGRRTTVQGIQGAFGGGRANLSNNTDSIRVFAFDPAILGTEIEQSLSRFDARWQTSMTWSRTDEPRNVLFGLRGVDNFLEERANFQTQLVKPLPTGGLAGITYRTSYNNSNVNDRFGRFNPEYIPVVEFNFEQPLLRGAGVGINQIRDQHPNGILTQINNQVPVPGILLTRIAYDQQQLEFERRVQELLFAVEEAYWDLYYAYFAFYSEETALRQAHATWQIAKTRLDVGRAPEQDVREVEQQYHQFRGRRLQALGQGLGAPGVLEAERRLRYICGLPWEDGCRIVPSDVPTTAPFQPDYCLALREGLSRRPELNQIRMELQAAHLIVLREKDGLMPDLRFISQYNVNALGSRLDGSGDTNALRNLTENEFNNWQLGLRMEMALGFREANAETQRAQLQLAQKVAYLQTQETNLAYNLMRTYREIFQRFEEIRIQRARREAAARQLELRYQEFQAGRGTIDVLLEAQRNWAQALNEEFNAVRGYNVALIEFERQKGTIMEHDNVAIVDGPLPACAQARASEHIRERMRSPQLVPNSDLSGAPGHGPGALHGGVPEPIGPNAPPIPALLDQHRGSPVPEELPRPSPAGPAAPQPVPLPANAPPQALLPEVPRSGTVVVEVDK
jgi:outer membrane protein TolC